MCYCYWSLLWWYYHIEGATLHHHCSPTPTLCCHPSNVSSFSNHQLSLLVCQVLLKLTQAFITNILEYNTSSYHFNGRKLPFHSIIFIYVEKLTNTNHYPLLYHNETVKSGGFQYLKWPPWGRLCFFPSGLSHYMYHLPLCSVWSAILYRILWHLG